MGRTRPAHKAWVNGQSNRCRPSRPSNERAPHGLVHRPLRARAPSQKPAAAAIWCDNLAIIAFQARLMAITLKNEHDIAQMRVACKLASEVLDYITPFVTAGVTTGELDRLCHEYMLKEQGTVPAPLNYQPPGYPPSPKATCISVNDV